MESIATHLHKGALELHLHQTGLFLPPRTFSLSHPPPLVCAARWWQEVTLQIHPQPGAGRAVSCSISLNEPWGRERLEMLRGAMRSSPCSVSLGSSGGRVQPAEERGNKAVSSFKYAGSCPRLDQLDSGVVLGCILRCTADGGTEAAAIPYG